MTGSEWSTIWTASLLVCYGQSWAAPFTERSSRRAREREREALLVWIVNPEILIAAAESIVVQFDFRPCWTVTLCSLLQRASLSPLLYISFRCPLPPTAPLLDRSVHHLEF
ncbi:hypothetical protein CBS147343_5564 [Aspergillus niger]|nr:hypothetical protein CBS147344_7838 [Aspergillus niger]KAI3006904.1 hypothetical protein CBS147345_7265 [Aspergillus niger]KAI3071496.1 hypothetical protein CBS147343_5564 [Aspergillus niger]